MINIYDQGKIYKADSLIEGLGINKGKREIISFVGAGGKTTLLFKLAEEYKECGIKTMITTTTHMMWPDVPFIVNPDERSMAETVAAWQGTSDALWLGYPEEKNGIHKMTGISKNCLDKLMALETPILIEADGSRRLPMKVPASHEPVIIPESTMVVGVLGIDAIGYPLRDVCFRAELAAKYLGCTLEHCVTPKDLAWIAANALGLKKSVEDQMLYRIVINKIAGERQSQQAIETARYLEEYGQHHVILHDVSDREVF